MWTVEPRVASIEAGREQHDVTHVCRADQRDSVYLLKIRRSGQADTYAMARIGAIGDQILVVNPADPRVFDAILFVLREYTLIGWSQKRLRNGR